MIHIQLTNPKNHLCADVLAIGTGTVIWVTWPDDSDDPIEEIALGVWVEPTRFFRLRLNPDDDLAELSHQVFQGLIPRLEREWVESPLPQPGEATGLHGKCKFAGLTLARPPR